MLKPLKPKGIKRRKIAAMVLEGKWLNREIMASVPCSSATLGEVKHALKEGIYFAPIDWRSEYHEE